MTNHLLAVLGLLLLPSALSGQAAASLAITGATVIDGTGAGPITDATIVVENGVITAVGPSQRVRIPDGAERIDARGRYIVPGFIDVNVHMMPYNLAVVDAWSDSAAIGIAVRGAHQLARHGVTTARDSYGILPLLAAARDALERDSVPGTRLLFAGNILGWGDSWSYTFSGSTGGGPRDAETRRVSTALVQGMGENLIDLDADSLRILLGRYLDAGPDFIKIGVTAHAADPSPILFAPRALAAMVEVAHGRGKHVDAHAGTPEALRVAALAGVDVLQHPEEVSGYRMTEAYAREIVSRGATCALMPGVITGERWAEFRAHVQAGGRMWPAEMPLERMRARSDSLRRAGVPLPTDRTPRLIAFENKRANAELLIRVGCRIAVATDDVAGDGKEMGEATLRAIEGLVELGMTPMQAIVAATRNGAAAVGEAHRVGEIRNGFSADLIVLQRNPLERIDNIRSIETVIVRGRPLR